MKKLISLLLTFSPLLGFAQIPVTDGVSAGILTSINVQTIAQNKLITKQIANQQLIIKNQQTLIKLIERQNQILDHTDKLKTEEIETYKKAPESIIVDYQLHDLEEARNDIVKAAKDFVKFIQNAKNLETSDFGVYEDKIASIVEGTIMAFKQTQSLLTSNDKIIPARERQELLQTSIEAIKKNIAKIKSFENELNYINQQRNTRNRFSGN
ncbi:MAG: hypothetical protein AAF348_10955 [Bacteroidota bacterium]